MIFGIFIQRNTDFEKNIFSIVEQNHFSFLANRLLSCGQLSFFSQSLQKKIDLRQKPQVVTACQEMHKNCATKGSVKTEKMVETKTYSEARFSSLP